MTGVLYRKHNKGASGGPAGTAVSGNHLTPPPHPPDPTQHVKTTTNYTPCPAFTFTGTDASSGSNKTINAVTGVVGRCKDKAVNKNIDRNGYSLIF